MSTPQRIEKAVRLNLTQRLHAAEAKIVEEPMLHGQKVKGWWLITPVGNFQLRGRGGRDTNAAPDITATFHSVISATQHFGIEDISVCMVARSEPIFHQRQNILGRKNVSAWMKEHDV